MAGDTLARLTGTNNAGLNTVNWNLAIGGAGAFAGFGGGGGGGRFGNQGPVNAPGFPAGFDPRPAESRLAPDSSGTPTAQARALAATAQAAGGRGQGGWWGFGGQRIAYAETGDYRVVLVVGDQSYSQVMRVVRVSPEQTSVLVPAKR